MILFWKRDKINGCLYIACLESIEMLKPPFSRLVISFLASFAYGVLLRAQCTRVISPVYTFRMATYVISIFRTLSFVHNFITIKQTTKLITKVIAFSIEASFDPDYKMSLAFVTFVISQNYWLAREPESKLASIENAIRKNLKGMMNSCFNQSAARFEL